MTDFVPPAWISAYRTSPSTWPVFWDRSVLERVLRHEPLCQLLGEYSDGHPDEHLGEKLLEQCLGIRSTWEGLPKIARSTREDIVYRVRRDATALADLLDSEQEALRAHYALPFALAFLFPELPSTTSEDDEPTLGGAGVPEVLRRLAARLQVPVSWEDEGEVPDRPQHENALRTYTVKRLINFFQENLRNPNYAWVSEITNLILDDPQRLIDASHVAKLDRKAR